MSEWVIVFCILAAMFAIATLIYVVGSIIKGIKRRSEDRSDSHQTGRSVLRTEGVLLITGLLCAASGLLLGRAISKSKEDD